MTPRSTAGRKCANCNRAALRRHTFCAECKTLCSRCRVAPKTGHTYCAACNAAVQKQYRTDFLTEPGRLKGNLRNKINREIREGKRKREPCAICQREPSFCYFPNMTIETMVFLCRTHHDQMTDRTGTQAKAQRELKEQKTS